MGIWIRSQNKESLGCTNKIGYTDFTTFQRRGHFIVDADENNHALLGEYTTKDRALQVLDEIQKRIAECKKANFLGMEEAIFVDPVFQMPES
jgi:hypothetical protein